MADARIVRQRLRELLATADMEVESQRSLTRRLEEELGVPLSAHKPLIKEEIDAFLSEEQDDDEAFEGADAPAAAGPATKKRRGADGGALPAAGRLPPGSDLAVPLSAKRFACVRRYGGRPMADVREYYEKDGELKPGSKGMALQAPAWATLAAQMPALSAGLEAQDEGVWVDLGGGKRASVSGFKGRYSLDLREHYQKDGEGDWLPTKKGVALGAAEWEQLVAAEPRISQALQAGGGGAPSGAASGAAAAAAIAAAAPATWAPAAGAPAAAPAPAAAAPAAGSVELSASRRAEISTFKGTTYVGLREFYQKDGQWLPGSKGISLPRDQFNVLRQRAPDLDRALRDRTEGFELQLSAKRKATVSSFKGKWMVGVREFYEKDGQMLPGKKGISLPEEQWARLLAGLPGLAAALEAA